MQDSNAENIRFFCSYMQTASNDAQNYCVFLNREESHLCDPALKSLHPACHDNFVSHGFIEIRSGC